MATNILRTGPGHPLGAGLAVLALENDHRGSSQLIYCRGLWYRINVLGGKIISSDILSLIAAKRIAVEHGKQLPMI